MCHMTKNYLHFAVFPLLSIGNDELCVGVLLGAQDVEYYGYLSLNVCNRNLCVVVFLRHANSVFIRRLIPTLFKYIVILMWSFLFSLSKWSKIILFFSYTQLRMQPARAILHCFRCSLRINNKIDNDISA